MRLELEHWRKFGVLKCEWLRLNVVQSLPRRRIVVVVVVVSVVAVLVVASKIGAKWRRLGP